MKKTNSMATIEPKNEACDRGAAPTALVKWLRFAPSRVHCPKRQICQSQHPANKTDLAKLTPMNRAGTVARTARAKNSETTLGGFVGSDLNVCEISGCLP